MCKSKNRYFYHILTTTVAQIERDIGRKSSFFHTPLHSTPPLWGFFPSEKRHPVWCGKTRMVSLPDGEKISKVSLVVLAQLTNVTDGRTDRRRTPHAGNSRAMHSIARQKLLLALCNAHKKVTHIKQQNRLRWITMNIIIKILSAVITSKGRGYNIQLYLFHHKHCSRKTTSK